MRIAVPLALLVLSAASSAASAASPVGEWASSTGNSVTIPSAEEPFVIVLTTSAGAKSLYSGRWVPGLEGTQFRYQVGWNDERTATFDGRGGDRVVVAGGEGADATWTRTSRGFAKSSVSGAWRSSSGNRFTLLPAARGQAGFDIVLQPTQGDAELFPARWVPGLEGTQFTYDADYVTHTATLDARTLAQIRVVGGGAPTMWTREGRAPRWDTVFGDGREDATPEVQFVNRWGERSALVCRPFNPNLHNRPDQSAIEIRFGLLGFVCDLDRRVGQGREGKWDREAWRE